MDAKTALQHAGEAGRGNLTSLETILRAILNGDADTGETAAQTTAKAKATARVVAIPLPLTSFRETAAMKDALGDAGDATSLGLADAAGSPLLGTTTNGGGTASASEVASVIAALPQDYVDGEAVTLRVRAKVSAAREVAQTVDAVVKKIGDGALGSDICATAVKTLTAAYADYDFTITPASLAAGDLLQIDLTLATDDTGGSSNGAPSIAAVSILPTVKT